MRPARVLGRAAWHGLAGAVAGVFLFPVLWMILNSLKTNVDVTASPPVFLFAPTIENYANVFRTTPFFHYFLNSVVVAGGSTALALAVGLPGAYALARMRRKGIALALLVARMAPGVTFLLPWYIMFGRFGLIDTHLALILAHLVLTIPLTVWVMIGFFESVPTEIEESARLDGCTRGGVFWRIAVPLSLPGIAVAVILSFVQSWNYFLFALALAGNATMTLPIAAFRFVSFGLLDWGGLSAAAVLITLPPIVLALFVQRYLVQGLTWGALKG